MSKSKINLLSWMCVLRYPSFVYICAYANIYSQTIFNHHSCVRGPLRECCSIRSGASVLPYYCAPLVCVAEVIELLAVWRHNKPKTKNHHKVKNDSSSISKLCTSNNRVWRALNRICFVSVSDYEKFFCLASKYRFSWVRPTLKIFSIWLNLCVAAYCIVNWRW